MPDSKEKKEFTISRRDAERVVESLELAASWDKTEIYYKLKQWLEDQSND